MVFHWSLSDSKSPQVSRTLLRILAVLNIVVVWLVSPRPPTSKSYNPFNNPLVTVPKAPIMMGIIVTFLVHIFFDSLVRSRYLSFSLSFSFILWSARRIFFFFFFFFFVDFYKVWSRLSDPFMNQSPIGVYVRHSLGQILGCAYTICSYGQI